jgi:hypothetical protein
VDWWRHTFPPESFWHKTIFDPTIFWVMLTAVATVALVLVGYFQLAELVRTRKSEFAKKLHEDFSTPIERSVLLVIARKRLRYRNTQVFDVAPQETEVIEAIEYEITFTRETISTAEVMRVILNPLEYLGQMERHKTVTLEDVAVLFGSTIRTVGGNEEIWKFIHELRMQTNNPALFSEFEHLYAKVRKHPLSSL